MDSARHGLRWLAVAGLLAGLAAGARAGTGPPPKKKKFEVKAWAGVPVKISMFYHPREWMPITVELTNNTKTDKKKNRKGVTYRGRIVVRSKYAISGGRGRSSFKTVHTVAYESPEQSVKRYTVAMWLHGLENSVEVEVYDRGIPKAVKSVSVTRAPQDSTLTVIFRGRNTPARFMKNFTIPGSRTRPVQSTRRKPYASSGYPEDLPRGRQHLCFADAVVVLGAPEEMLEVEAIESLLGYAQSGGSLVLASAKDFDRYAKTALSEPAGAFLDNTRVVTLDSLPGLVQRYRGREPPRTKGLRVPRLLTRPGTEVIAQEFIRRSALDSGSRTTPAARKTGTHGVSVPTVVRARCGAGSITTVAFDVNSDYVSKWDNRGVFVEELVSRSCMPVLGRCSERVTTVSDMDPFRSEMGRTLDVSSVIKHPPRRWVASFLAIYLILVVPLCYVVFNAFGRREMAWALAPALSIAFAVYAYGVGYWGKEGKLSVTQMGIIETSARAKAGRASCYSAVYSPVRDDYDIDLGPETLVAHLPVVSETSGRGELALDVDHCGTTMLRGLYFFARTMRYLETRSMIDLGGRIDGRLDASQDGLIKGDVLNGTGMDLAGCVVVVDNDAVYVGDLPAGGKAEIDVTRPLRSAPEIDRRKRREAALKKSLGSLRRNVFIRNAGVTLTQSIEADWQNLTSGVLIGWTERPGIELKVGDAPISTVALTAVICRLPVSHGAVPRRISGSLWVPGEPLAFGQTSVAQARGTIENYGVTLWQNSQPVVESEFRANRWIFVRDIESLTIKCRAKGAASVWEVEIRDPAKPDKWQKLGKSFNGGSKTQSFTVEDPGKFIRGSDGSFRVRVQGKCSNYQGHGTVELLDAELQLGPEK